MSSDTRDTSTASRITAVILAGGRATRMGGADKGLLLLNGKPMIDHIVRALRPQVSRLVVNANRNQANYSRLCECEIIEDIIGDYAGPLAGMASALEATATDLLLVVPCDSPLIAPDLASRMAHALVEKDAEIAVANDGERMQPVFTLLRRELLPSLRAYLEAGDRKIDIWFAKHQTVEVDFSDHPEMFFNVNTPDERTELEDRLRRSA